MLQLLLAAALLIPAAPQDSAEDPPTPELVEQASDEIDTALRGKQFEKAIAALTAYGRTYDAKVVKSVAKGLKHKRAEVQLATLETLRFNVHPDSLATLHKTLKSDKKLRKDEALYTSLIKAVCQHGDTSSLPLLSKNPLDKATRDVAQARILGYGMIRDPKSVEALMALMQSVDFRRRQTYMEDFRTSLYLLSGVDKGTNVDAWQRWWNDNKKQLEVAPKPPKLPELLQIRWNRYWGLDLTYDRKRKRAERGDDPE